METSTTRDFIVEIVDPCPNAILSIDTSILLVPPSATLSEVIPQTSASVTWTNSIISTSIAGTDPCGVITEEVWDVSTGSESTLDPSKFTLDTSIPSSYTLSSATADPLDAGTYSFRYKVFYDTYAA